MYGKASAYFSNFFVEVLTAYVTLAWLSLHQFTPIYFNLLQCLHIFYDEIVQ